MLTPDSGFICISLPPRRLQELQLPPLLPRSGTSQDPKGTAYHLTIDADGSRHPTTTGISGHDRAYAARLLADGSASADEFTRPGHIVTLRYTPGGVVKRRGHTEAAVGECHLQSASSFFSLEVQPQHRANTHADLCYLAGQSPAGVLCELTNAEDPAGSMARRDDCYRFARTWGLKIISVDALASYAAREGSGRIPKAQDLEV